MWLIFCYCAMLIICVNNGVPNEYLLRLLTLYVIVYLGCLNKLCI